MIQKVKVPALGIELPVWTAGRNLWCGMGHQMIVGDQVTRSEALFEVFGAAYWCAGHVVELPVMTGAGWAQIPDHLWAGVQ